jgi:CBS domain-containing protein
MEKSLQVSDVMTKTPVVVKPTDSVLKVAQKLTRYRISSVLVMKDKMPVGIITTDDITYRVVNEDKCNKETFAKDIMSSELVGIGPAADIREAMELLNDEGIRQLPVLDKNHLVGYVTVKDILRVNPELILMLADNYKQKEEDRQKFVDQYVEDSYLDEDLFS